MTAKDLKDYKNNLYSSLSRDLYQFEKNFLFISGGILAFSITFIKDIVKIEQAAYLVVLFIAWIFIVSSIGLMMFTFLRSSIASDELWSVADTFIIENELFNDEDNLSKEQAAIFKKQLNIVFYEHKHKLRRLRFLAVGLFIYAIALLAIYVSINMWHENHKATAVAVSGATEGDESQAPAKPDTTGIDDKTTVKKPLTLKRAPLDTVRMKALIAEYKTTGTPASKQKLLDFLLDVVQKALPDNFPVEDLVQEIAKKFLEAFASKTGENLSDLLFNLLQRALDRSSTVKDRLSGVNSFVIRFDHHVAEQPTSGILTSQKIIESARSKPKHFIILVGSADRSGEAVGNILLGYNRAKDVEHELVKNGVDRWRIIILARPEKYVPITTRDGMYEPENRRVDVYIL